MHRIRQAGFAVFAALAAATVFMPIREATISGGEAIHPLQGGGNPVVNVKDFGARGDGRTDDYAALQKAARAINSAGGGTLVFPPGSYRIGRYRITGGASRNQVGDIAFTNCDGLVIRGYGARIDVFGNFRRSADDRSGRFAISHSRSVTPFRFRNCRNFTLAGLEIDGNVDQMSRDQDVAEAPASAVATSECSNYTLKDLYVHHFATDGIYLGGSNSRADRNATLTNVRSKYNGRQGLSIIQLRGGRFLGCVFNDTGRTGGSYGAHRPTAGVDVEPNHTTPAVDVRTGNLVFERCTFENNQGPQFQAGMGDKTENLTLRNCVIRRKSSAYDYTVILAVAGGLLEDSRIDIRTISATWSGKAGIRTVIRNNRIWTPYRAVHAVAAGNVVMEGNRIVHTTSPSEADLAAYTTNPRVSFRRNTVILPAGSAARIGARRLATLKSQLRGNANTLQ